jgi:hypothetical protein
MNAALNATYNDKSGEFSKSCIAFVIQTRILSSQVAGAILLVNVAV